MKLVVGLGNPGRKYKTTKHNIGFMCLDYYVKKHKLKLKKDNKFNGETLKIGNIVLLKPHTFMNESGQSIRKIINFYNIKIENILVIYDDLDLPLGKTRLREKGSSAGHNGIKSIISNIQTQEFKRVRIGIDKNPLYETKNYVLSSFSKKEKQIIEPVFEKVSNIIEDFCNDVDFIQLMTKNN
ncbi:MAG: aminoacyl-tRNA hydrolase [Candidatus Izimaplasma sp.]|nr:aminoacyl-tRNA hydrolase [Candidatus Izimaplasma bacterium]